MAASIDTQIITCAINYRSNVRQISAHIKVVCQFDMATHDRSEWYIIEYLDSAVIVERGGRFKLYKDEVWRTRLTSV